jgi:hypothetical protein
MKAVSLIIGLAIGLALSLAVALGVAWYFMRDQDAGPDAVQGTLETEDNGARPRGAAGPAPENASEKAARIASERSAKFEALDTEKDGKLTLTEFTGDRQPAEAARWFERRDVDHDGFVSLTEYLPALPLPAAR